ncbi:hypothetical protein MP228_004217 [Amoeboaphelidium protococcarum]|nr:hypothetical protein MP228_004217 [Amoeboaphelidium protococcarum]
MSNNSNNSDNPFVKNLPQQQSQSQSKGPTACFVCRAAHVGCDKKRPCGRCTRLGKDCIEVDDSNRHILSTSAAVRNKDVNLPSKDSLPLAFAGNGLMRMSYGGVSSAALQTMAGVVGAAAAQSAGGRSSSARASTGSAALMNNGGGYPVVPMNAKLPTALFPPMSFNGGVVGSSNLAVGMQQSGDANFNAKSTAPGVVSGVSGGINPAQISTPGMISTPLSYSELESKTPGSVIPIGSQGIVGCLNCRTSHVSCDKGRPCSRCVRLGTTAHCIDPPSARKLASSGSGRNDSIASGIGLSGSNSQSLVSSTLSLPDSVVGGDVMDVRQLNQQNQAAFFNEIFMAQQQQQQQQQQVQQLQQYISEHENDLYRSMDEPPFAFCLTKDELLAEARALGLKVETNTYLVTRDGKRRNSDSDASSSQTSSSSSSAGASKHNHNLDDKKKKVKLCGGGLIDLNVYPTPAGTPPPAFNNLIGDDRSDDTSCADGITVKDDIRLAKNTVQDNGAQTDFDFLLEDSLLSNCSYLPPSLQQN